MLRPSHTATAYPLPSDNTSEKVIFSSVASLCCTAAEGMNSKRLSSATDTAALSMLGRSSAPVMPTEAISRYPASSAGTRGAASMANSESRGISDHTMSRNLRPPESPPSDEARPPP